MPSQVALGVSTALLLGASLLLWGLVGFLSPLSRPHASSRPQQKLIAGVPVYNYHRRNETAFDVMGSRRLRSPQRDLKDQQTHWVLVLKELDPTGEAARRICRASGMCLFSGNKFLVVKSSEAKLDQLLSLQRSVVAFVEPDVPAYKAGANTAAAGRMLSRRRRRKSNVKSWGLDRIDQELGTDGKYKGSNSGGARTGAGVHVYVLDTGVRTSHNTFEGRAIPALDTINGQEFICDKKHHVCAQDDDGHGTHVAGTIGGKEFGVAKGVTIHAVKTLKNEGTSLLTWSWKAMEWVARFGQRPAVISMSIQAAKSQFMAEAVHDAAQAGVTVVLAAGNTNQDACDVLPASAPEAIRVAATNKYDQRGKDWGNGQGSNYGACVDIFAPGEDITSSCKGSNKCETKMTGTSMAAPHVSGAVALLLQQKPGLLPLEVKAEMQARATKFAVGDARPGSPNLLLRVEQSPCSYGPVVNKSYVQGFAGDKRVYHKDFTSDELYLAACEKMCTDNSKCLAFVDDNHHDDYTPDRMCKPKKNRLGSNKVDPQDRPNKVFYEKNKADCGM